MIVSHSMRQAKKARRPVHMAATKTAHLWLTETGETFYEGVAVTIGGGSVTDASPFPPTDGMAVKSIGAHASASHVAFLQDDGSVYCVGEGEGGQLGDGKEATSLKVVAAKVGGGKKDKKKDKKKKEKVWLARHVGCLVWFGACRMWCLSRCMLVCVICLWFSWRQSWYCKLTSL